MIKNNRLFQPVSFLSLLSLLGLIGCSRESSKDLLGSAVVECRTYAVATTAQGPITALFTDEGRRVNKGDLMAVIDTVPLSLQRQGIIADREELATTVQSQETQSKSIASEVTGALREFNRADELFKKASATEQQRDLLGTQLQTAQLRFSAAQRAIFALQKKNDGLLVRLAQVEDQLKRCYVTSPASGMVLTRYRNTGEVVPPANPIVEIGDFDTLYADFFVPQPVLATLKLGRQVRVRIDFDEPGTKENARFVPATITWIGDEAEFSPKNIQTRQSRNELVFRVRATMANAGGVLKRGLPVEIWR